MKTKNIADIIVVALSLEATTWPKPGLVTALNTGCLNNMNMLSFFKSAIQLRPFFEQAHSLGNSIEYKNDLVKNVVMLRSIGINAESAMFDVTRNVNTHKGAIFMLLILVYCVGFIEKEDNYKFEDLFEMMAIVGKHILKEDFFGGNNLEAHPITTGQLAFKKYQILGIRGVAADGFQLVVDFGIPIFHEIISRTNNLRIAIVGVLLKYMSVIDDTTIMNRKFSINRLRFVKSISAKCIKYGGYETIRGRVLIKAMEYIFTKFNISPGGSADLVSLTLAIYFWYFGYPNEYAKW